MNTRSWLILAILTTLPSVGVAAPPPPGAQREIVYLLEYVETSGCLFYRNGKWYDGKRAEAHLRTKYDYLVRRNLIGSAEEFIDRAATSSSLSRRPYKIKCGTVAEVESGPWLHEVLARYRSPIRH